MEQTDRLLLPWRGRRQQPIVTTMVYSMIRSSIPPLGLFCLPHPLGQLDPSWTCIGSACGQFPHPYACLCGAQGHSLPHVWRKGVCRWSPDFWPIPVFCEHFYLVPFSYWEKKENPFPPVLCWFLFCPSACYPQLNYLPPVSS